MIALKYYYYKYYTLINFIITLLIFITFSNLVTITIPQLSIETPSLDILTEHFNYKLNFIKNSEQIIKKTLKIDIITLWQKNIFEIIISENKAINLISINDFDYYSLYFPLTSEIPFYMDNHGISHIYLDVYEKELNAIPKFDITLSEIEKTPIITEVIVNNDLPFESPVEIHVENTSDSLIIIAENVKQEDKFISIYGPSYEGPQIYSETTIFDLHLKIINIITNIINAHSLINNQEAIPLIRNTVHDYLYNSNLINNLTIKDLQNLLLHEMIANSLFVSDQESFILKQVIIAIIIDVISKIENTLPDHYYNDPILCNNIVKHIISRFL